jgi:hypothetical protein
MVSDSPRHMVTCTAKRDATCMLENAADRQLYMHVELFGKATTG